MLNINPLDEVITPTEAIKLFGITQRQILLWCKNGNIKARFDGSKNWLILKESVQKYMDDQKSGITRFMEKIKKDDESGCWIWTASLDAKGYGAMGLDGRVVKAHRYSYEYFKSLIPEGMLIRHACDNPKCVNPEHLFTGTHQDNSTDMVSKGRAFKGESHHMAKLTEEQILEIRNTYTPRVKGEYSMSGLSKKYGVASSHIFSIIHNKIWKGVKSKGAN